MKIIRDKNITSTPSMASLAVGAVFMAAKDVNSNYSRDYLMKVDINGHHRVINLATGKYVPIDPGTPVYEVEAELHIGNFIVKE